MFTKKWQSTLYRRMCSICALGVVFVLNAGATEFIKKTDAQYHSMCGCKDAYYVNTFEKNNDADFSAPAGGTVVRSANSPAVEWSATCDHITTPEGEWATLTFGESMTGCYMNGNSSWLKGLYFTEEGKYLRMKAQYIRTGGSWAVPADIKELETIFRMGIPRWSKFDYYFDFSAFSDIKDVRLLVASPGLEIPAQIDNIDICYYCRGELQAEGPRLKSLAVSAGELMPEFKTLDQKSYYTIKMSSKISTVSITPTIEDKYSDNNSITIRVLGSVVPSGTALQNIPVHNGTIIDVTVEKNACEKTLYLLEVKNAYGISFASGVSSGFESQDARIPVSINPPPTSTISVPYNVQGGSAKGGANFDIPSEEIDYINTSGILTFSPSVTTQVILVPVNHDTRVEANETFGLSLVTDNPGMYTSHTYTIVENQSGKPAIFFTSSMGSGTEDVTSPGVFVSIDPPPQPGQTMTIEYAVTGGTASGDGYDYTLGNGTLSFDRTNTSRAIPLTIIKDDVPEFDETVVITLSNPTNGAIIGSPRTFNYTISSDIKTNIVYVKTPEQGGNDDNDGRSWTMSKATIGAALAVAATLEPTYINRVEIWVAKGTYRPLPSGEGSDIVMLTYVDLLGGFPDGGTKADRNWKLYQTVISGDRENNDPPEWPYVDPGHDSRLSDNVGRVIRGASFTTFDGFVVERGWAHCTAPYPGSCSGSYWGGAMYNSELFRFDVRNCRFQYNMADGIGGGAVFSNRSLVYFDNCIFSHNYSSSNGGAVANYGSNRAGYYNHFTNCQFDNNTSEDNGGGVYLYHHNSTFKNCTFVNNACLSSFGVGGALCLETADDDENVHVRSSIFYDNTDNSNSITADVYVSPPIYRQNTSSLSHVRTGYPWTGAGSENTTALPLLTPDYHISGIASPCYNHGYPEQDPREFNVTNASGNPVDLDNHLRFRGTIDMGAYEFNSAGTLTGLISNIGTLSPGFSRGIMGYTLELPFGTTNIYLTATFSDASVVAFVDGNRRLVSGVPTALSVSPNQAVVIETYVNGILADTYTIIPKIESNMLYVRANITTSGDGRSWSTAYKYLQDALAYARNNPGTINEIRVAAGTYYPDVRWATRPSGNDDYNETFAMQTNVSLKGGYPANGGTTRDWVANATVLSGDIQQVAPGAGTYSLHVVTGANATFDGFTVEWGKADNSGGLNTMHGGGMLNLGCTPNIANCTFCKNSSMMGGTVSFTDGSGLLKIENCIFEDNPPTGYLQASAISCSNTDLEIKGCRFSRNAAEHGGAINFYGGSNLTITGSQFSNNSGNFGGGAVLASSAGSVAINNCTFNENTTEYVGPGGAVQIINGNTRTEIADSRFTSNRVLVGGAVTGYGGAVFYEANGTLSLINCAVQSNMALHGSGIYSTAASNIIRNTSFYGNGGTIDGGGISIANGDGEHSFINCLFANQSATQGAGIYSSVPAAARFKIDNCTFFNNTATSGGGIYFGYSAAPAIQPEIKNTILWGVPANQYGAYFSGSSSPQVDHSCIQDYQRPATENPPGFTNQGNIPGTDNTFGTADDGLLLTLGSRCINSGDPATDMTQYPADRTGTAIDIAKRPRSYGTIDIGAYERQLADNNLTVFAFNPVSASGDESAPGPVVTVTANPAPLSGQTMTVSYAVQGGTATPGSDFTLTSGTLSFDASNTSRTIPLTIINDVVTEANETVILTLSNPTGGGVLGAAATYTYTINDNDPPVVQFSSAAGSGLEAVANPVITVTANPVPMAGTPVSVSYTVSGTATGSGTDYTLANGTLTFSSTSASQTIPLAIVNDASAEGGETVIITLASPTGGAILGSQTQYTYTIADDDRTVAFASASGSGSEAQASQAITIAVSPAPVSGQSYTVNYAVSGTATGNGTDYTLANGTLTFDASNPSRTVTVSVVNDAAAESDETVIVTLSNPSSGIVLGSPSTYTYTILDNDRTVAFGSSSGSGAESVLNPTITVSLSSAMTGSQTGTVQYAVTGGTATGSGTDYTLANGTLSFDASNSSRSIPLTIVNDLLNEGDETVVITLSSPANLTLGATTVYTYTIQDNDPPAIAFTAASGSGAESIASPSPAITVTASPTPRSGQTFTVSYTVSGTATGSGTDYTLANGTLSFDAANTSRTLALAIVNDVIAETNETVVITLSGPTNGAVLGAQTTFTYTINDDEVPTIAFTGATGSGLESVASPSPAITATVSPVPAAGSPVSVSYTVSGTASGGGTDYTLANGTLTFTNTTSSQTIPLSIVNDASAEGNETVIITLSGPTGGAALGSPNVYTYTILDNDRTVAFAAASSSGSESQASQTVTVSVTPVPVTGQSYTVSYAATGGTATGSGTDYTLTSGTLTFDAANPSRTVPITVINDATVESDETVIITLSAPSAGITLGSQATHTFTILDNDRTVAFTAASGSGLESVASPTITVSLPTALASGQTGSVQYAVTGGTATGSGTDYTLASGTLSFDASNSSRTIPLAIVNDALNEASETVIITLSSPANLTLGTTTVYTYTITDDDPPTIAFTASSGSGSESVTSPSPAITVTATPTPRSGQTFSVSYTVSGTATGGGTDYTLANGTLSFDASNTSRTITPTIVNDALTESDETIIITLSNPTNGAVLGSQKVFTYVILGADRSVAFSTATGSNGETVTSPAVTVTLSSAMTSGQTGTVQYAVTGGTATGGGVDFTLASGTLSFDEFNSSRTIPLAIINDVLVESDETVVIILSNPSTGLLLGSQSGYTYTIMDNDRTVSFAASSGSGAETVASPNIVVSISDAYPSGQWGQVHFAVTGGTATGGSDYTTYSGYMAFNINYSSFQLPLTVVNDALKEGNETIVITLDNPINLTLGANSVFTYTINDDDGPTIAFTASSGSGLETVASPSPGIAVGIANLVSGQTYSVNYTVNGTATGGGADYTLANGTLSFDAANTSRTIPLAVVNDVVVESDETVIITLSSPTNGAILGSQATFTYTILDNDREVTFMENTQESYELNPEPVIWVVLSSPLPSGQTGSIQYSVTGGTATGGGVDFILANGTFNFDNTHQWFYLPLTIVNDGLYEADETIIITLSNPVGLVLGAMKTYTFTILNDD